MNPAPKKREQATTFDTRHNPRPQFQRHAVGNFFGSWLHLLGDGDHLLGFKFHLIPDALKPFGSRFQIGNSLDRMRHYVDPGCDTHCNRQAQRRVGIVNHNFRKNAAVFYRRFDTILGLAKYRCDFGAGIGCCHNDLRTIISIGDSFALTNGRAAAKSHNTIGTGLLIGRKGLVGDVNRGVHCRIAVNTNGQTTQISRQIFRILFLKRCGQNQRTGTAQPADFAGNLRQGSAPENNPGRVTILCEIDGHAARLFRSHIGGTLEVKLNHDLGKTLLQHFRRIGRYRYIEIRARQHIFGIDVGKPFAIGAVGINNFCARTGSPYRTSFATGERPPQSHHVVCCI